MDRAYLPAPKASRHQHVHDYVHWGIRPSAGSLSNRKGRHATPAASRDVKGRIVDHPSSGNRSASCPPLSKPTFRWIKGELIGRGSYGKVYLAFNATTGELMAVKQVERPLTPSDQLKSQLKGFVDALREESKTLQGLDHRNIVQYLGFEENSTTLNIFLEYIPGGTIHSCLRLHGIFRQEVTKKFTAQILEGLHYLHCKGIIHRDLKAENILVEPSGVCKISDFGISKNFAALNHTRVYTAMRGTSYWMAPEVIDNNKKGYDIKADIWSVGCVVLEMWTAERPWHGEELFPVMMKLIQWKLAPPIPESIILPETAQDFRTQCFHGDPQKRPTADALRKHAYLELPANFSFPGMLHIGCSKASSDASNTSEGTITPARTKPHPPSAAPPLVHITPPGSPKQSPDPGPDLFVRQRRSSVASESSDSQQALKAVRRLVVFNPDVSQPPSKNPRRGESPEPQPYVYNPPPLPEPPTVLPYSSALGPLPQIRSFGLTAGRPKNHNHQEKNIYETQPLPIPQPPSRRVGREASHDTDSETDSATNSTSSSTWKKPPNDVAPYGPRPTAEEVYQHITEFFPNHDLDNPIVESAVKPKFEKPDTNNYTLKSIRNIAEEQVCRGHHLRRGTRLWDSCVEEIEAVGTRADSNFISHLAEPTQ